MRLTPRKVRAVGNFALDGGERGRTPNASRVFRTKRNLSDRGQRRGKPCEGRGRHAQWTREGGLRVRVEPCQEPAGFWVCGAPCALARVTSCLTGTRVPKHCRSSDSTARIWTVPDGVEKPDDTEVKVLRHGTGPHKDVTTLEWNVRRLRLARAVGVRADVKSFVLLCSTMARCWRLERTTGRLGFGPQRAR